MPKNKGKGGKGKRKGKRNKGGDAEKAELRFKVFGEEYAQVRRVLGNCRVEAYCFDGKLRLCHVRGKFKKRVWINKDDFVLVGLRDYQDDKSDVIHKYTTEEARLLRSWGEIPADKANFDDDGALSGGEGDVFLEEEGGAGGAEGEEGSDSEDGSDSSDDDSEDELWQPNNNRNLPVGGEEDSDDDDEDSDDEDMFAASKSSKQNKQDSQAILKAASRNNNKNNKARAQNKDNSKDPKDNKGPASKSAPVKAAPAKAPAKPAPAKGAAKPAPGRNNNQRGNSRQQDLENEIEDL